MADVEDPVAGERAEGRRFDPVLFAESLQLRPRGFVDGHDHALLGLAEPDLPGAKARILQRGAGQVDLGADPLGHLADRGRQTASSAIGDSREQPGGIAQHVDQQLLDDRVTDLHAGTGNVASRRVHRGAGERCATETIASRTSTEHDDQISRVRTGQRRSVVSDADASAIHQRVGDVSVVVENGPGDGREADLVAVVGDAGDDTGLDQTRMQDAVG